MIGRPKLCVEVENCDATQELGGNGVKFNLNPRRILFWLRHLDNAIPPNLDLVNKASSLVLRRV